MVVELPKGGLEVLRHVQAGRSPWTGWDAGVEARMPEGHLAYRDRSDLIVTLRRRKLLTDDGLLTDLAEGVLDLLERQHG